MASTYTTSVWNNWARAYHETVEQKKVREAVEAQQQLQWQAQEKIRLAEQAAIKARAEKILVKNLSPEQKEMLLMKNYFDVPIEGKLYRIHRGTHGNIREIVNGVEVAKLCVQPDDVPTEDAMLAQLLWLRADEKGLLRIANRTALR